MRLLIQNTTPVSLVPDTYLPTVDQLTIPALPRLELSHYTPDIIANQMPPKEAAKFRVKVKAGDMIESLQWRIERAQERDSIGAEGETLAEVLREREAIRRASNRAEAYIDQLDDNAELSSYQLDVLPSDYPANAILTRLQFMRRFTDAERATIRAARDSGQSQDLLDFWELLQLASHVNINDADIQAGVQMLEQAGLIDEGRAQAVLDGWPMA